MKATFLDETGKPQLMQMGCYGIGITRLPARHRAEQRRARHHLARRHCAVHGRGLPDRHGPQRRGEGGGGETA
jgi:hypothetical protein